MSHTMLEKVLGEISSLQARRPSHTWSKSQETVITFPHHRQSSSILHGGNTESEEYLDISRKFEPNDKATRRTVCCARKTSFNKMEQSWDEAERFTSYPRHEECGTVKVPEEDGVNVKTLIYTVETNRAIPELLARTYE